jgi:hypothetical protein
MYNELGVNCFMGIDIVMMFTSIFIIFQFLLFIQIDNN